MGTYWLVSMPVFEICLEMLSVQINSLFEPMLTSIKSGSIAFTWRPFHKKCPWYQSVKMAWIIATSHKELNDYSAKFMKQLFNTVKVISPGHIYRFCIDGLAAYQTLVNAWVVRQSKYRMGFICTCSGFWINCHALWAQVIILNRIWWLYRSTLVEVI